MKSERENKHNKSVARVFNNLNHYINDDKLRQLLHLFLNHQFESDYYNNLKNKEYYNWILNSMLKLFCNTSHKDLSWDTLCSQVESADARIKGLIIKFYQYLAENKYALCEFNCFLQENLWIFIVGKATNISRVFYAGSNPLNIVDLDNDIYLKSRFNLNTKSSFIRELLKEYLSTLEPSETMLTRHKEFIYNFEKSLYAIERISETIYEFNYKTFTVQYRFYKHLCWDKHKATTLLLRFYIFLHCYIENNNIDHQIFTLDDRIDKYSLYKGNFDTLYDKGFRVIRYNRFDSVPLSDRWLVAPNGEENISIPKKAYMYTPIDFSILTSSTLKNFAKSWFWYTGGSLYAKEKNLNCIFGFVVFLAEIFFERVGNKIQELYRIPNKAIADRIDLEDIIEYRFYISLKYSNLNTINSNIKAVKSFLQYIIDNWQFEVDLLAFDYLKIVKIRKEYGGNPIIKEDLDIIVKKYKENDSKGDFQSQLDWIIFNLCVTTNMRVGEILNLKRNCLQETMKSGQFVLMYESQEDKEDKEDDNEDRPILNIQRKGSNGEYKEENINRYTELIIRNAIRLTQHLSMKADDSTKEYLFLTKALKNTIRVIELDSFYRRFKRIISHYDLKGGPYTVYHLRDTFMTNIFIQGKKEGKSTSVIHEGTGHADLRTSLKYYRIHDIQGYLEAMYGVMIGNVNTIGTVVLDITETINGIPPNIKSITVNEECGFCRKKECLNGIPCLICPSFVTTLDRIPFFEKKVAMIDDELKNESIEHEKEHLLEIKKLCVGYLHKLFELKVNIDADTAY